MSSTGSSYITQHDGLSLSSRPHGRTEITAIVSALFALVIFALALIPATVSSVSGTSQKAEAGFMGLFCQGFGNGMDGQSDWKQTFKSYPAEDKSNRVFTLDEAFANGTGFVSYHGEGKGGFGVADKDSETPDGVKTDKSKLESLRTLPNCTGNTFLVSFSNFVMSMSNGLTGIAGFFTSKAFDSNLICSDPSNTANGCFNLIGIIGGTGSSDGGIIGTLTSSIYYPLIVIAAAITAFWVAYKGIVQRKIREAFFGALWVALSVIFGLAMLLNPALIAKAPLVASNSVATCVIGAFNGQNCFDSSSTGASVDTNGELTNVCQSSVSGASLPEQMSLTTNSINCSIWRAFILNPLSEGSFGTNFEGLNTTKGDLKTKLEDTGLNPNDYCVSLKSSGSASSMYGKTLALGTDDKVCNLMAYQMFLKTNSTSNGSSYTDYHGYDQRWYKIIDAAASDDGMWQHWAPSTASAFNKLSVSFISLITSALGMIVLVVAALFALVYLISSVILMAFAPIFFLIGVHPGRGKSIMLGWLEKVLSNVLKYMASAVFVIVALAIYGGILGNLNNMALTLLFVVIVTMALMMYRHELMDMFGKVNMGGERMSSAVTDKLRSTGGNAWSRSKRFASATAGGAIGSMAANGSANPLKFGQNFKAIKSGAASGAMRDLKRSNGLVGNVARQVDRDNVANRQKLRDKAKNAELASSEANESLTNARENLDDKQTQAANNAEEIRGKEQRADENRVEYEKMQGARADALGDMRDKVETDRKQWNSPENPDRNNPEKNKEFGQKQMDASNFINMKDWQGRAEDLKVELQIAEAQGETLRANEIRGDLNTADQMAQRYAQRVAPDRRHALDEQYAESFNDRMEERGLGGADGTKIAGRVIDDAIELEGLERTRTRLASEVDEASRTVEDARRNLSDAQAREKGYGQAVDKLTPGSVVTSRKLNKVEETVAAERVDRGVVGRSEARQDRRTEQRRNMGLEPREVPNVPKTSRPVQQEFDRNGDAGHRTEASPLAPRQDAPRRPEVPTRGGTDIPRPTPTGVPVTPEPVQDSAPQRTPRQPQGGVPTTPEMPNHESRRPEPRPQQPSEQRRPEPQQPSVDRRQEPETTPAPETRKPAERPTPTGVPVTPQPTPEPRPQQTAATAPQETPRQTAPHHDARPSKDSSSDSNAVSEALKNQEAAVRDARAKATAESRRSTNERLKNIQAETNRQVQEIEQQGEDLRARVNNFAGGTHTGERYEEMLGMLDEITNAQNASNAQIDDSLKKVSQMNDELSEHTSGLAGSLAPDAQAIRNEVDDQIARIKSLQEKKAEEASRNETRESPERKQDSSPRRGGIPTSPSRRQRSEGSGKDSEKKQGGGLFGLGKPKGDSGSGRSDARGAETTQSASRRRGPSDADRGTTENLNGDGKGRGNFGGGFKK